MPVPPDYGEHYLSAACVGSNSIGLPLLPPYGRPRRLLALEPIPGSHVDGAADRAGCKAVVVSQSSVPTIRPTTTHQKGQLKVMHTDTRRSLQSRKARLSRQRCAQPAESPHAALCTSLTLHQPGNIEMESVRPLSGCLSPGDTGLIAF
jgi:hypothetical protein